MDKTMDKSTSEPLSEKDLDLTKAWPRRSLGYWMAGVTGAGVTQALFAFRWFDEAVFFGLITIGLFLSMAAAEIRGE